MSKHSREKQLNKNAGFSLIELLIAVIVLAIIIVPFARSFMSSSRMNGNSRRLQRATTVAQDIMEGLKAYNIEELKEQFNNSGNGFYVIDSKLVHGDIIEDTYKEQHDGHYSGNADSPGVYYFVMKDLEIQNVKYDALIKLDSYVYTSGHLGGGSDYDANYNPLSHTAKTADNYKHDNAFNSTEMAKPSSVMKGKDGSYTQDKELTNDVLNEIKSRFGFTDPSALVLPEDEEFSLKHFKDMGGKVSRTITIDIDWTKTVKEKNEAGVEEDVRYCDAKISMEYECEYKGTTVLIKAVDEAPRTGITSGNFYLFYYPCYEAVEDNIIIDNNSKGTFQIYIVKQVEMDSELDTNGNQKPKLSDSQLNIAEKQYKAIVNIKGNDTVTNDIKNVALRTNLGMNLVNSAFFKESGGPTTSRLDDWKLPTNEVEKEDDDIKANITYKFNGVPSSDLSVYGLAGSWLRGDKKNNVIGDKITEVIFDIEVSIYQQGASDDGFPESQRMVVIEGSKNN